MARGTLTLHGLALRLPPPAAEQGAAAAPRGLQLCVRGVRQAASWWCLQNIR